MLMFVYNWSSELDFKKKFIFCTEETWKQMRTVRKKKIQLIAIQLGRKGEKKDLGFDFFIRVVSADG